MQLKWNISLNSSCLLKEWSTKIGKIMSPWAGVLVKGHDHIQARIQEFQNGGGGARSRRGRILRSKVCFDASLHIPYVFVRRVVNNIHILNTAC